MLAALLNIYEVLVNGQLVGGILAHEFTTAQARARKAFGYGSMVRLDQSKLGTNMGRLSTALNVARGLDGEVLTFEMARRGRAYTEVVVAEWTGGSVRAVERKHSVQFFVSSDRAPVATLTDEMGFLCGDGLFGDYKNTPRGTALVISKPGGAVHHLYRAR